MDAVTKYFVEGDNNRVISGEYRGSSLVGYTVTGRLLCPDKSLVIKMGLVTDAEAGLFVFTFDAADLQPGRSHFEAVLETEDGTILHLPERETITVIVRANLKAVEEV